MKLLIFIDTLKFSELITPVSVNQLSSFGKEADNDMILQEKRDDNAFLQMSGKQMSVVRMETADLAVSRMQMKSTLPMQSTSEKQTAQCLFSVQTVWRVRRGGQMSCVLSKSSSINGKGSH